MTQTMKEFTGQGGRLCTPQPSALYLTGKICLSIYLFLLYRTGEINSIYECLPQKKKMFPCIYFVIEWKFFKKIIYSDLPGTCAGLNTYQLEGNTERLCCVDSKAEPDLIMTGIKDNFIFVINSCSYYVTLFFIYLLPTLHLRKAWILFLFCIWCSWKILPETFR